MRYLNKIIFLNSAHIPYAEVKLDGNVHFIGTQGVGKSTLLRALLFFYNADKSKLGIPPEKRGFDSFYFMYANSYIVYEVMRENGAYCVVLSKSQGRALFRFVDAPFDRNWFMDDKREVIPEWNRIRERIGQKCYVSAKIESYGMYRDIIFGNNRGLDVKYRKFAIVENAKYQNIPRTIQNVFLNSKLDADFIKDTIIRSMNDEDSFIDLQYYREQIREFEQEYRDVMLWFEKNKSGEVPVRKQAEKVMVSYRSLLYVRKRIEELRAELNFAEKRDMQYLPAIQEEIRKGDEEAARYSRLAGEEQDKHNKEREGLVAQIGVLAEKLKQVAVKRNEYAVMRIDEVKERVMREDLVRQDWERTKAMKDELTYIYNDIISKYEGLHEKLTNDFRSFENELREKVVGKQSEKHARLEELLQALRLEEEQVRGSFVEKFRVQETVLNQLHADRETCRRELLKLSYERPFGKEMDDCEEGLRQLRERDKELEGDILLQRQEIERLRQEGLLRRKELQLAGQEKISVVGKEQAEVKKQLASLDRMIEKWKGSFCEWLEQHKPDWPETIGKVVDAESVLYNSELNPRLSAGSDDSLFGIHLNVDVIDRTVSTPADLRKKREECESTLRDCMKRSTRLTDELAASIATEEKKYNKRIREITSGQQVLEAERVSLPSRMKQIQADLATLKTKEIEWKDLRSAEIESRMNEIARQLSEAEQERSKLDGEQKKQLKACQKKYEDGKKARQAELDLFTASVRKEISERKEELARQKTELVQAQAAELSGKGLDMSAIRQYDLKLETFQRELDYIREHRQQVFDYEKDKRDLLDRENEFRRKKKEEETKRDNLDLRFRQRWEKLLAKKKEQEETLVKCRKDLDALKRGLQMVEMFRKDETLSPPTSIELGEKTTRQSCEWLVNRLKSEIVDTMRKNDDFRKAVNQFKSNFSAKNTFNFKTELLTDQDHEDFAASLCEFIDYDMISDFQKRISERYTDIIRRISKEVGDLTRNESEIHGTIDDINKDFIERNFAGVIKEIALKPQPSSDKLMLLLLEIKKFNDDNQYNMGEVDLFSQASREAVNATAVRYLLAFMKLLLDEPSRNRLLLSDTFNLVFRVKENDNDTGWVEKIGNVGSDGTDILVKAMVNIMLINVFKEKASRKFGDFKLHCMMDEIGKLHPNNVKGILDFANSRNILLVNSSPTTYNVVDYKYTYLLSKDGKSNTLVVPLLTKKEETS